jgi:hypothetical protein
VYRPRRARESPLFRLVEQHIAKVSPSTRSGGAGTARRSPGPVDRRMIARGVAVLAVVAAALAAFAFLLATR